MAAGKAVEVTTVALSGQENAVAHPFFSWAFCSSSYRRAALLGIARRRAAPSGGLLRTGATLLVATLPSSIVFGFVGSALTNSGSDTGLRLAMTTPYGLTWVLLGPGLRENRCLAPRSRPA